MDAAPNRTAILPPKLGVRIAWDLTLQYSQFEDARDLGRDASDKLTILDDVAKSKPDSAEGNYLLGALALIRSSQRTLQIIIEGRNLNTEGEDKIRENKQQNILYYSQFTSNLQSILPRLGSMTVVGAGGSLTVAQLFGDVLKDYPPYIFPLIVALAVGIGYLLHSLVVVPIAKKSLLKEEIRADYSRNLYFDQYYKRSRNSLINLYIALQDLHLACFRSKYDDAGTPRKIVEDILDGVPSTMCPLVHEHMNNKESFKSIFMKDLWPMCESGQGVELCPLWESQRNRKE